MPIVGVTKGDNRKQKVYFGLFRNLNHGHLESIPTMPIRAMWCVVLSLFLIVNRVAEVIPVVRFLL